MPNPTSSKRFKTNPVEIAILTVVTLILCNSVYRLFEERSDFKFAALAPMTAQPTQALKRNPAAVIPDFYSLDVNCDSAKDSGPEHHTAAGKLRLSGPLCSLSSGSSPAETGAAAAPAERLLKSQITNSANQYMATVFTDLSTNRFSTDYIPLVPGKNLIEIEFTYSSSKFTRQFSVMNADDEVTADTQKK